MLLSTILVILYAGTLHSPWILDDQHNILDNPPLHITDLSLASLKATFFTQPFSPGTLYRPLACASFALNWFFGQDNPVGYHIVNISIHIFTAFFLYLVCLELLRHLLSPNKFRQSGHAIALFASLLWAINPIQTQAVTYIVQRMASLAALFSIISIYFFLKARSNQSPSWRVIYGTTSLTGYICAVGSKENAIFLPVSILLIEYLLFRSTNRLFKKTSKLKPRHFFFISTFIASLILGVIYLALPQLNYDERTFTLSDRILTQPRVLILYLSQIFFPLASRLSLEHDINLSSTFFSPWTTIPAIGTCIALIAVGLLAHKKVPLLSMALLFFFLNHAVESTIIPLEMIFEHRNYLPSLFLFLPIAWWWCLLVDRPSARFICPVLIAGAVSVMIFFGVNTFVRNQAWSSAMLLMQDTYAKAPNSNRAATNLAKEYLKTNELDKALLLSEQAYHLWHPSRNHAQAVSLNAQGVVYHRRGDEKIASQLFQQSIGFLPKYGEARKNLIVTLCNLNNYQEAHNIFFDDTGKIIYQDANLQAIILLRLQQPKEALAILRSAPRDKILSADTMTGLGKALSMMGYHQQADFYLRQAASFSPLAALNRIENFLLVGEIKDAKAVCLQMLTRYKASDIFNLLIKNDPTGSPVSLDLVTPLIMEQILRGKAT